VVGADEVGAPDELFCGSVGAPEDEEGLCVADVHALNARASATETAPARAIVDRRRGRALPRSSECLSDDWLCTSCDPYKLLPPILTVARPGVFPVARPA